MGSTSFTSLVAVLLWGISLRSAYALPVTAGEARVLERASQVKDSYDYIIVGGGTSGLTVGDRLTEDGKCVQL
jgi:choline dehydrogenase